MTAFNWVIQEPVFDKRLYEAKDTLESCGDQVFVYPTGSAGFDLVPIPFVHSSNPTIVMGSIFLCSLLIWLTR